VRGVIAALVALVVAAGCSRPSADVEPGAPRTRAGAPDSVRVSLERRPCFGTCPVYTVTLDGSGAVRFEGRKFVKDTGTSVGTVPPDRVDSLLAELEAAGYFSFADRYARGEPTCPRYASDLPIIITEVRIGSRLKRIEHNRGCADAPERLSLLENRIDEVAGTERWVRK
jgi:uncharacterized protein DUF6438